jgi:hypothetical protein
MKQSEIDLSQCLQLNARCKKCDIELDKVNIPFRELPKIVKDYYLEIRFDYQILECPKCGYCGIHTY